MLAPVLHFYSGNPLQVHSGVDILTFQKSGLIDRGAENQLIHPQSGHPHLTQRHSVYWQLEMLRQNHFLTVSYNPLDFDCQRSIGTLGKDAER